MHRRGRHHRLAGQVSAFFVIPGGLVVDLLLGIEAGVQAVFGKLESVFNNESRVGVVDQIFVRDAIVLDRVIDQPAKKSNVRSGANLHINIRSRCGPREARIYDNGFRVAMNLGFHRPLKAARMVLRGVPTHDQHHVGVLDVDPAIGHRPASECWPQTGDRRAVSNPGLVFQVADPQAAHGLYDQIIKFIGVGAAAGKRNSFTAVDSFALTVGLDESVVAGFLYLLRNFGESLIPGNIFPLRCAGTPHLRLE